MFHDCPTLFCSIGGQQHRFNVQFHLPKSAELEKKMLRNVDFIPSLAKQPFFLRSCVLRTLEVSASCPSVMSQRDITDISENRKLIGLMKLLLQDEANLY